MLALSGTAAIGDTATTPSASPPLQQVSLQLRWHHQFQFAGYYVAKELGFYREAGTDVEIREGGKRVSPVLAVTGGEATFGIDGSGLLVARGRGQPVVAVAAIFQKSPLRLITRGDIQSLNDLAGRRVMLLPGFRSLSLIAMLDQTGMLDRIVRVDSSADVHDLVVGNVDAFNGYNTNEPYTLAKAGIDTRLFDPAAYGIQLYGDVLFTAEKTAQSNPQLVSGFLAATRKGWIHALDNQEAAIRIIRERYNPNKSLEHLRFEASGVRESIMPDLVEIGHMSGPRWTKIRDQLATFGLVAPQLPVEPFMFRPDSHAINWVALQPYLLAAIVLLALGFAITAYVIHKNVQLRDEVERREAAERRARHLAMHDYLTGLPNRLLLMDRLEQTLARAQRHATIPLLAFVDLDHFKQLNDRHGHERGDQLLRDVASAVGRIIRDEDTFARIGGDEFVLLIDHMPPKLVETQAERLLMAIRVAMNAADIQVTVGASIGVVSITAPDQLKPEDAMHLADALMYEVKRGPRNHYRIAVCGGDHNASMSTHLESINE
jgi:diguanylate cyclase (GGDEF)-like protein